MGGIVYEAGLNFYDLYGNCTNTPGQKLQRSLELLFRKHKKQGLQMNVPCIDTLGANIWLNKQEVQAAFHVKKPEQPWQICSDILDYRKKIDDMFPFYMSIFDTFNVPGVSY